MAIFSKPPLGGSGKKRDMPEGLWHHCPECKNMVHDLALRENLNVCPHCSHHFLSKTEDRIEQIVDRGSFKEIDADLNSVNVLGFQGYEEKVEKYKNSTGLAEAITTGLAKIDSHPVGLGIMDFRFLGASMGSVVGEKITRLVERSTSNGYGVVLFSASGGARMHEGIMSLMQMAKTSGALARHSRAGLPYISVLTHPTTGGVTASFATLGDVIIAEPQCMIGFAGPRVVKETTHQDLPPGFQTAEFMKKHGLVDIIVPRNEMRKKLAQLLGYMMPSATAG